MPLLEPPGIFLNLLRILQIRKDCGGVAQRGATQCHRAANSAHIIEIMNFEEYQSEASQTALYPGRMSNLEYPTLGLAGEAGEVANIVKKIQRDFGGKITPEVRQKLKDELGDVLWYISACADELGLTLAEIAEFNVAKLAKRHNR